MTNCKDCNYYDNHACTNKQSDCYGYVLMDYNGCVWGSSDWIRVEDRLPEEWTPVLAFYFATVETYTGEPFRENYFFVGWVLKDSVWTDGKDCNLPVTHWQSLPQPPRD